MMGKTGSLSSKSNKKDKELENNFLKFVDIWTWTEIRGWIYSK